MHNDCLKQNVLKKEIFSESENTYGFNNFISYESGNSCLLNAFF